MIIFRIFLLSVVRYAIKATVAMAYARRMQKIMIKAERVEKKVNHHENNGEEKMNRQKY